MSREIQQSNKAPRHHNDNFESDKRFIETVAELRETNFCKFSSSWDLDQKYHIGDRIVKKKGSLEILLIRQDIDTIKAHLYFKGDEILEEKRVRHINTFIQEHPEALKITSGANNVIYKEKDN